MEDKEQEVQEISTEVEQSSNEGQEIAQPESEVTETPSATENVPEVRKPQAEDVDDMGVPYKNRYMEAQRKLQKLLEEKVEQKQTIKQEPEAPKYTTAQLKAFAVATDSPTDRSWALDELDRITKEEQISIVRKELESINKQKETEVIRQRSFNTVISRNPDLAVKDVNGNFVRFNDQSPLFNRMNYYMSNPDIASRPEALEIAEAFAVRDLTFAQKPMVAKTIEKQANQIKSLQKKTMVEGGGVNSNIAVSSRAAAVEKAKQTGSVKDAANAMGAILRDAGLMTD